MARKKITRRDFVTDAGKLALGAVIAPSFPMIVPRHVLGGPGYRAPSDMVHFAVVGFGGMGSGNAQELAKTEQLVAVCDVDLDFSLSNVTSKQRPNREGVVNPAAIKLKEQFDKAAKYTDFREMLSKQKDIDGIVVATPDHNHAVVAKAAMDLGKHVYVQKPLTWSVHECRVLGATAKANPKLVTQMGNQGHSSEGARLINEWIEAGVIGPVHEVHVWTNRPLGYWPQPVPRPQAPPPGQQNATSFGTSWNQSRVNRTLAETMASAQFSMPKGLRWDMYLGPVAEDIPYHPIYHPFNWRGWIDFGGGTLGDMGAHLVDHPFWALNLDFPISIEATSTPWGTETIPGDPNAPEGSPARRAKQKPVSFPAAQAVHYQFAARGNMPAVKMTYTDGGLYPPRPDVLPDDVVLEAEGGVIFIGEKGVLINKTYGADPQLYPRNLMDVAATVPKSIPRITTSHELNWARAIRGEPGAHASSPLEYAARLTETMLLGVATLRNGQGKKLMYDGVSSRFTNDVNANQYLTREYREGWAI